MPDSLCPLLKFPVMKEISSGDVMCSMATIVNNTVLSNLKVFESKFLNLSAQEKQFVIVLIILISGVQHNVLIMHSVQ